MPLGTERPDTFIDVFVTNVPAVCIWKACDKPTQMGLGGQVPVSMGTPEIEAVCRIHDVELTPRLLARIRHLDSAYRAAVIDDLNKKSANKRSAFRT